VKETEQSPAVRAVDACFVGTTGGSSQPASQPRAPGKRRQQTRPRWPTPPTASDEQLAAAEPAMLPGEQIERTARWRGDSRAGVGRRWGGRRQRGITASFAAVRPGAAAVAVGMWPRPRTHTRPG
jgi:hypothetical protein